MLGRNWIGTIQGYWYCRNCNASYRYSKRKDKYCVSYNVDMMPESSTGEDGVRKWSKCQADGASALRR